ncbi:hypothetical protein PG993_006994 [Apiospora rasikravindrae]|uniref:Uncharacterized protein n=1 Tax=Apiospora rasikravindrae TaxID=990691 RepID=A0ABR1SYH1_9PEZI
MTAPARRFYLDESDASGVAPSCLTGVGLSGGFGAVSSSSDDSAVPYAPRHSIGGVSVGVGHTVSDACGFEILSPRLEAIHGSLSLVLPMLLTLPMRPERH